MAKVNLKQIEFIGELWFQRANKLRDYWQDGSKPHDKRLKAFSLCFMMYCRLSNVAIAHSKLNSINATKYERGGL